MAKETIEIYEITYPYLTQLFGLSGWLVYTPIILTTDANFQKKPHVGLKQIKHFLRIVSASGQLVNEESYQQSIKEQYFFYWNKTVYSNKSDFSSELKTALINKLMREKLCGYIFREPKLYFSQNEIVSLKLTQNTKSS